MGGSLSYFDGSASSTPASSKHRVNADEAAKRWKDCSAKSQQVHINILRN